MYSGMHMYICMYVHESIRGVAMCSHAIHFVPGIPPPPPKKKKKKKKNGRLGDEVKSGDRLAT